MTNRHSWILDPEGFTLTAPDGAIYKLDYPLGTPYALDVYLDWVKSEMKIWYEKN